jgi:ribosomal protein S18 acetylase RimI-like enzyme
MLDFYRIINVYDPMFSRLYNLYTASFPHPERRSWDGLVHELIYEKRFFSNALLQDNEFVGFLNYWKFEQFYYIEHFAVLEKMRGKNIGSDAIEMLMKQSKVPIVFEVELPVDEATRKRVHFYERLGFTLLLQEYAQPAYIDDELQVPMKLMCNDEVFGNENFEAIKSTLYSEVYETL